VNGIKLFGSSHAVTFNNTVSSSGKWFGITTSGTGNTINIGGSFTSSDFYVMNAGTLDLNSGGSLTTSLRLGGDFGNTGNQDQTKSGDNTTATDIKGNTLTLTPAAGGTITHSGTIYNSTGAGGVTMTGAGTVTYSAAHTYSGDTLVNAGTLQINSGGSANNSII